MVYKADLIEKYGITFKEAGQVLSKIDQAAVVNELKEHYSYVIWDRVTPINGVLPEVIIENTNYPKHVDHRSYLLYKDDKLVYFQTVNPGGIKNYMTEDEIPGIVEGQINALVSEEATAAIYELVKQAMEELE